MADTSLFAPTGRAGLVAPVKLVDNLDGTFSISASQAANTPVSNQQGTLLPSALRTSTTTTPTQQNLNHRGVLVFLNITAASGTGGLQTQIQSIDPISGNTVVYAVAPAAIIATGIFGYAVYPGIGTFVAAAGGVNRIESGILGTSWRVAVIHGDGTNYTYSLGYALIR